MLVQFRGIFDPWNPLSSSDYAKLGDQNGGRLAPGNGASRLERISNALTD